jgi:methylated-DNA-[protein]-cysteine S-methyltransferase
MTWALVIASPIGALELRADDEALREVRAAGLRPSTQAEPSLAGAAHPVLNQAAAELADYFAGRSRSFQVPLRLPARGFAGEVLAMLRNVPFGALVTYGDLARACGSPRAARAAGSAVARNPLLVVVPCHRVVRANGILGGFALGPAAKRWLLAHEGVTVAAERSPHRAGPVG